MYGIWYGEAVIGGPYLLLETVDTVRDILRRVDLKCDKYMTECRNYVRDCVENIENQDFWKNFFSVQRCGSGSQEEICGDVMKLLAHNMYLINETPGMISRYPFKSVCMTDDGREVDCNFISGIMFSDLDNDNVLVPIYYTTVSYYDDQLEGERKYKKVTREYEQMRNFHTPNDCNVHDDNHLGDILKITGSTDLDYMKSFTKTLPLYMHAFEEAKVQYRCPNFDKCKNLGYILRTPPPYGKLCNNCRIEKNKIALEQKKAEWVDRMKDVEGCYNNIKSGQYTFTKYNVKNEDTGYMRSYCVNCIKKCMNNPKHTEELCEDKNINEFCFCNKCEQEVT